VQTNTEETRSVFEAGVRAVACITLKNTLEYNQVGHIGEFHLAYAQNKANLIENGGKIHDIGHIEQKILIYAHIFVVLWA